MPLYFEVKNPLRYPHEIRDKIYWLNHVLACWDMIEHFYIWPFVQKLYFLLYQGKKIITTDQTRNNVPFKVDLHDSELHGRCFNVCWSTYEWTPR